MPRGTGRTFRSLGNRNFRLYFIGQMISQAGTFMQVVAQSWLVLKLTGSGTAIGVVTALQFVPMLLLGGLAGVFIDRVDRRLLCLWTQAAAGLEAFVLGVLVLTGAVRLWMVFVMALLLGIITMIDQPNRQAFLYDMVGPEDLTNAVSLQMAIGSTSRAVGPAVAGLLIAVAGIGQCFLLNAASFLAVIISLLLMRTDELHRTPPQPRAKKQFRAGLSYVRRTPELFAILVLTAVFFGIGWDFEVVLPLVAKYTFHGGAGMFGLMTSAIGIGAVIGGLYTAAARAPSNRMILFSGIMVSLLFTAAAGAPTLAVELLILLVLGFWMLVLSAATNSRLQLHCDPAMRGRVMALWTVAAVGTRPVGGPLVGFIGQVFGARASLLLAGVMVLVALVFWYVLSRVSVDLPAGQPPEVEPDDVAPVPTAGGPPVSASALRP